MNRLDKIVVFRPLGMPELRDILSYRTDAVQERIFDAPNLPPFVITVTNPAREYVAQGRHRYEIRRPPSEAGHRPAPGASAVEPHRHRAGLRQ